jgi:hypothetical protein
MTMVDGEKQMTMRLELPWIGQLGNRVLQDLKAAVTRGTGGNWSGAPPNPRPPRVTVQRPLR